MDLEKSKLVQILLLIGAMALVGVFAVLAVGSAKMTSRDAVRLSDVRQVQSALEDFFNERSAYPEGATIPLGDTAQSACLSVSGFRADCSQEPETIMRFVPRTLEVGIKGLVTCGNPARKALCYTQTGGGEGYGIAFELEHAYPTIGLRKGTNCAVPGNVIAGACPIEAQVDK